MGPVLMLTLLWLLKATHAQTEESIPPPTLPDPEKLEGSDLNFNSTTDAPLSSLTETTTETTTEITTALPTSAPSTGINLNHFVYCSCDLVAGQCDLNCCCDLDCSADDRALFKTCWSPPPNKNDHMYCSRDDYAIAWNNTSSYRTENGGLFCVVTDNVPRYKVYEEKPPLKGDDLFRLIPRVMNRWTESTHQYEMEKWVYEPFYREGSPLFTLHAKGALGTLSKDFKLVSKKSNKVLLIELPGPLNSAYCNIARPIEFLRQQRYQCHLKKQSCKPLMNAQEWLSDLAVFKMPPRTLHGAGNFTAAHGVQWNDAEKLAPVILRICDSEGCRADVKVSNQSCQIGLVEVTLRVGINGTQGVVYVLADLHYANGSLDQALRFETIFQPVTDQPGENSAPRVRSGNPGYIKGKPLLTAKFNQTSGEGEYQPLTLFPNTLRPRQIIFGQNSLQTVQLMKPWKGNLTDWCPSWQKYVLGAFWGSELAEVRIGPFGNSNLQGNKMDQWLPIEIQTELSCFSTTIRSDLMVVYTKTGTYEQPQNKIIGVALGLRSDREAKCNTLDGCTLLLTQSVSFVHSETGTSTVLPQPPRWRVHLPHDFFYPFLLSSSGAKTPTKTFHVSVPLLLCFIQRIVYFSR